MKNCHRENVFSSVAIFIFTASVFPLHHWCNHKAPIISVVSPNAANTASAGGVVRGRGMPSCGFAWSQFWLEDRNCKCEREKERSIYVLLSSLGYPDSNQERQDQNLQCYHYTIAQNVMLNHNLRVISCAKVASFALHTKCFCIFLRKTFLLLTTVPKDAL